MSQNKNYYNNIDSGFDYKEAILNREQLDYSFIKENSSGEVSESEEYFIKGYNNIDKNNDIAMENLQLAIDNFDNDTNPYVKIYSHKFISDIYVNNDDIKSGVDHIAKGLNYVDLSSSDENFNVVEDLYDKIILSVEGRRLGEISIQEALRADESLSRKNKNNLSRLALIINILERDYSYALSMYTNMINIDEYSDSHIYTQSVFLMATMDIVSMYIEIGVVDKPLEMIERCESIEIEDKVDNAIFHTYRLINLAMLQSKQGLYDDALSSMEEIEGYKKQLNYDISNIENMILAYININENYIDTAKLFIEKVNYSDTRDDFQVELEKKLYYMINGKISVATGDYESASNYYEESMDILEYDNFDSVKNLISIYSKLGEEENKQKYIDKAIDIEKDEDKEIGDISVYYKNYKRYSKEVNAISKFKQDVIAILIIIVVVCLTIFTKLTLLPKLKRKNLAKKVKTNLKNNNYKIYYQPIVNMKDNSIVGFEGLLRLDKNGKLVFPSKFLKEIDLSNMMGEVSIWILRKIIEDYDKLKETKNTVDRLYVSMNISLDEIEDDVIFSQIKEISKLINLKDSRICLEIVETKKGKNQKKIKANIKELKECGYIIAIDDFGVDYSNVSSLSKFEYNIIKMDKYFIDNVDSSTVAQSIIKALDYLSMVEGKSIVLEGLELKEQKSISKYIESERFYIQGYYYSRPLSINEIVKLDLSSK